MKNIRDAVVLVAWSADDLNEKIQTLLERGFVPQGGVAVSEPAEVEAGATFAVLMVQE